MAAKLAPVKRRALALASIVAATFGCEPYHQGSLEPVPPTAPMLPPAPPPRAQPAAAPFAEQPALHGRLPSDVHPLHYALSLRVDPDRERFDGIVEIEVALLAPRRTIWLHARDVGARRVAVISPAGKAPIEAAWEAVDANGLVKLTLAAPIEAGVHRLHVEFDAPFSKSSEGLFVTSAGGERYAFTDLEPSDARRIFPCFDEPTFKAPMDVSVVVPVGMRAVANAHPVSRAPERGGGERWTFATTEPLPTYLFELAVGALDVVNAEPIASNAVRNHALPLRGVATAGRGKELAFALSRAADTVRGLEDYFGIAYPYDKLDLLAVPDMGGAMENAGAITFREWLLFVDEKTAPIAQRRALDSVLAHEVAHQWFGDLVTMKWWDDLWLNEAFATWMAGRLVQTIRTGNRADVGLLEGMHRAMDVDSLASARAIRQPIVDQNDVFNAFDAITYSKGGGVLAMFERFIGADVFQRGIHDYLSAHRGSTATTDDLMAALSKASGRDVATPFKTFLDQPGVPFVSAKISCDKGAPPVISLRQSRDVPLGSKLEPKGSWQIPVCVRYGDGAEAKSACTLLTGPEATLPVEGKSCPAWVMPNADGAGYYRFSLPPSELAQLLGKGWASLRTKERISVAANIQASFARGDLPVDAILKSLESLSRDADPSVLVAPMGLYRTAHDWTWGSAAQANVEARSRSLYAPSARDLGWSAKPGATETPERRLAREEVLRFMVLTARDPEALREGAKRGRAYVGFGSDGAIHEGAVDAELVTIALSAAVDESGPTFFEALEKRLLTTTDDLLRSRILSALGSATRPELAERARNLSLNPALRMPEVLGPLFAQASHPATREATWKFLEKNVDALAARLPSGRSSYLPALGSGFCDAEHEKAVKTLFDPRATVIDGLPRNLAETVETIDLCIARKARYEAALRTAFEPKSSPTKTRKAASAQASVKRSAK